MEACTYDNHVAGRKGNWMQTASGKQFWPIDPRPEDVDITDIAAALSKCCRFAGHSMQFYSVAEHCVHVSYIVPPEMALIGLLHDATEAYVVDIPRPLKPFLSEYHAIEERVWHAIADRFCVSRVMPPEIKVADNAMLLAEREHVMAPSPFDWLVPGEPANIIPGCWSPYRAEINYLKRFEELTKLSTRRKA